MTKFLRPSTLASAFFATMSFFGLQANSIEAIIDSDRDGLPDAVEIAHNLDPFSRDSDADGLSDYDEFPHINGVSFITAETPPTDFSALVADAPDTDGDGLNDFMESFGFYIIDNTPVLAARRIHVDDWADLKNDATAFQNIRVFDVALSRLELDSRAVADPNDAQYLLLNLDGAKNAIIDAYVKAGISPTSLAVQGLTNINGSAADIIDKLLTNELAQTRDNQGNALPVYFTHPRKISSDHDPYTDLQEVLGIFPAGRPLAPADHPLIAAAPALKATLEEFDVILIEQNSTTLGEEASQLTGTTRSKNRSQSYGVSVAIGVEKEFGLSGGLTSSIEVEQSNTWSFGSSTDISQQNAFATYTQNGTASNSDCFARLDLNLAVENTGYANASNINLAFNVYLGSTKQPWQTFQLSSSDFGNLLLAPGQKHLISALRDGELACLTMDETNYLAQGGTISIETIVADASVDFFDADSNLVQQGGSWQVYKTLIEQDLAMMNIDVNATDGERINHAFYYVAAQADYPQLRLTIGDVLAIAFEKKDCDAHVHADARCFITPEHQEIVLGNSTFFDTIFYDSLGVSLPLSAMESRFRALEPLNNNDIFQKQLTKRSAVTVINNDFEAPKFTHIEVINRVRSEQDGEPDVEIRATASDFFGLDRVEFCVDSNNCTAMNTLLNDADELAHSALFSIVLPNYRFSGTEFLKARNIVGNESQKQNPKAFFLILHERLNAQLAEYVQHLHELQTRIDALSRLQTESPVRYSELLKTGFISSVNEAQSQVDALKVMESSVREQCTLVLSRGDEQQGKDFAAQFALCRAKVVEFSAAMQNSEIKAFNIAKLPGAHFRESIVGRTKAGQDRPNVGVGELRRSCSLGENQYAVGIAMSKENDRTTPVDMTIQYVEFDPLTKTLSGRQYKQCGNDESEKSNTLEVDSEQREAELILDVGIHLRDSITEKVFGGTRGSARYVDKLCVTYRRFNFATGQWLGGRKIKCNNQSVDSFKGHVSLETGLAALGNDTMALKSLRLYHYEGASVSEERDLFAEHTTMQPLSVNSPAFHSLSEFTEYALINEASGDLLTLTSLSSNSAAVGMEAMLGKNTQSWKIQRINDRAMRLSSVGFGEGVFVRNIDFEPSVAKLDGNDAMAANDFQHFVIRKISSDKESAYVISSVIDGRSLTQEGDSLVWQKTGTTSAIPAAQRWYFMPLKNEAKIADSNLQTHTITQSARGGFNNACQTFDLGEAYYIKQIRMIGKQNRLNKSLRTVRLSPGDAFSFFVFPPSGNFNQNKTLSTMSNATRSVEICNQFLTDISSNGLLYSAGNDVDAIEIQAIPAGTALFK